MLLTLQFTERLETYSRPTRFGAARSQAGGEENRAVEASGVTGAARLGVIASNLETCGGSRFCLSKAWEVWLTARPSEAVRRTDTDFQCSVARRVGASRQIALGVHIADKPPTLWRAEGSGSGGIAGNVLRRTTLNLKLKV